MRDLIDTTNQQREYTMMSIDDYRSFAEDCMRRADEDDRDKLLWITLAQSWLRLAEDAESLHEEITTVPGEPDDGENEFPTSGENEFPTIRH